MVKRIDPLHDFTVGACVMRFVIGIFFGVLLDGVIVGIWLAVRMPSLISFHSFAWLLGCLPVVWGTLSIFWLELMTEFVGSSWEEGLPALSRFSAIRLGRGRRKP